MWQSVVLVSCLLAAAGAEQASQQNLNDFLEWFQRIGGAAPKLSLAQFDGMGSGVQATQAVREGDPVITVPLQWVACRQSILASADPNTRDLFSSIQTDEQLVASFLVQQKALGDRSPWRPYIQALPKSIPLSLTLTPEELAEFQDEEAVAEANQRRKQVNDDFNEVAGVLRRILLASDLPSPIESIPIKEWYIYGVTVVDSRALTIRGQKFLVPFADMFNYAPQAETRDADRGSHFLKYHILGEETFTVKADRDAQPGSQLFEDYGDNPNTIYAHHHGFVPSNNPFDCIPISLPDLKPSDGNYELKRKLVQQLQLTRGLKFCIRSPQVVSRRFLDYIFISAMTSTGLKKCEAVINGILSKDTVEQCLGDPYSPASFARAVKFLKQKLDAYPASADDAARLQDSSLSEGRRLGIAYRASRKALLQTVIREFEHPTTPTPYPTPLPLPSITPDNEQVLFTETRSLDEIVKSFNAWFTAAEPPVNLLEAAVAPDGMRLGTFANRDIAAEELYLSVPTSLIMDVDSATKSGLRPLLVKLRQRFRNGDPFHELLFHLLYEKFQVPLMGKESFYKPYLDTLPTEQELDFPLFYSESEIEELQASELANSIRQYQGEVKQKYDSVSKFIQNEYPGYIDANVLSYPRYRWAHAILDSRAIWWDGQRHLVPMLDLINCVEGPNPDRVHSTQLDSEGVNAVTYAPWAFTKGSQVYENYGQPNHIYFKYHGFVLDSNTHDCVSLPVGVTTLETAEVQAEIEKRLTAAEFRKTHLACLAPSSFSSRDMEYIETAYGLRPGGGPAKAKELAGRLLARYPTSIAEDVNLLQAKGRSWRYYAAIKLRLSEKRILSEIVGKPSVEDKRVDL